jgi:hypothetical protein
MYFPRIEKNLKATALYGFLENNFSGLTSETTSKKRGLRGGKQRTEIALAAAPRCAAPAPHVQSTSLDRSSSFEIFEHTVTSNVA